MRAVTAGLGLGAVAGLVESVVVLALAGFPHDAGPLAPVNVAVWSVFGAAAGLAGTAPPLGRRGAASDHTGVLRGLVALTYLALVGHVNSGPLSGAAVSPRLTVNLPLLALAIAAWFVAPRVAAARGSAAVLERSARMGWIVFLVTALASGGFALALRRGVVIAPYELPRAAAAPAAGKPPSVMVLGVDAAGWDIVMPLVQRGEMPVLCGLMQRGTWGVMRSYEVSRSPTVWTSIATGKPPAQHGIEDFVAALATNRRAMPVWQIASALGRRSAVIGVPGTYPIVDDADVMLSGFPLPMATGDNRGWLATTTTPVGPPAIHLGFDPARVASGGSAREVLDLQQVPADAGMRVTAPMYVLSKIAPPLADRLLFAQAAVSFGRIALAFDAGADGLTVAGRDAATGRELFALRRGEWSRWLVASIGGRRCAFQVRFLDTDASEIALFVTPFYPFPEPDRARPADELAALIREPYASEGVGWSRFRDPRMVETLREHLIAVEDGHAEAGLAVLDHYSPDFFFYVFTVTDRVQHMAMKFAFPEVYDELARSRGGEYARLAPTPEQVRRFGDAIASSYRDVDRWMGQMLERAGPDTRVIVVSDHGAKAGPHSLRPTAGVHDTAGVYVVTLGRSETGEPGGDCAAAVADGGPGPELRLEDLAPMALQLLGLPVAEDMTGRVPEFVAQATGPVATIASYESEDGTEHADPLAVRPDVLEQLKSLGYVD